jgi:hypothetical protein
MEEPKEQSLEQAVSTGCELGVRLAACASESTGMDTTEDAGIAGGEGTSAIRGRRTRAKGQDAAKPRKRTNSTKKTTVRIRSAGNPQALQNRGAAKTSTSSDRTAMVGARVRSDEAKLQERAWLLAGNKTTGFEKRPDSGASTSPSMGCALETVVLDQNHDDRQLAAAGTEREGSLRERPLSRGLRRDAILGWLTWAWKFARRQLVSRQSRKRLRVCESVSLGEKRFIAVIEVDGEQFLVGGASSSVATLARLEPSQEFSELLKRRWERDPLQV